MSFAITHLICVCVAIISLSLATSSNRINKEKISESQTTETPTTSVPEVGTSAKRSVCDSTYPYRSVDGSCNNLDQPDWGRAGTPFIRLLDPAYDEADGNTPRLMSRTGKPLPSARRVSTNVHQPANVLSSDATVMLMQWGQFLDHDITHTVQAPASPTPCCDNMPRNMTFHPDVRSGGSCNPIVVPDDDPYFTAPDSQCIPVTRSARHSGNKDTRQQFSDTSAFIDGSQIYGNTQALQHDLRAFQDGKLRVKVLDDQDFLPDWNKSSDICFKLQPTDYCFLAGDARVNVYPGLTAMHTVFLRYHNRLCDRLKQAHPEWNDEKLFQEARRIVGAILQKVTFSEYLKTLFGEEHANLYNLLPGDPTYGYRDVVDATLTNEFTTAAFRFGHSSVPDYLVIGGQAVPTGQLYMRPKFVLNSLDDVIRALITGKQQRVDRLYSPGITDHLFEPPARPQGGYDLVAMNIQRGRDHGIPDYNTARQFCGLGRKENFSEMETGQKAFSEVYDSPDDIDLYSGQLSETPHQDARVGPLLVCLLGAQFRSLKFGDRFWYENQADPTTSLTPAQVTQVNSLALAKVICDVTGLDRIQPDVFRIAEGRNTPVRCSGFRDLDIERVW